MPHDCNGNRIEKGDEVFFRARVRDVFQGDTACNFTVEVIDPNGTPTGEYTPVISCNTRLCQKPLDCPA